MAISMMSCRTTCASLPCTTTAGFRIPGRGDRGAAKATTHWSCAGLRSSFSTQLSRVLCCPESRVGLSYAQQSSSGFGGKLESYGGRERQSSPLRPKLNYPHSSNNQGRGVRLGNGSIVTIAAAACPSGATGDDAQQSDGDRAVNFLHRIATLRVLPVLLLGLGVVLSLRPGHAWGAVANETLSPSNKGLLASAWAGLVAGCLHTLTGPDHLAALAPLCIGRSRLQSAAVGALWGFGHDTGQIIFGLVFLVLKDKLHIELIRIWASRVVGLTLVTIGCVGIYESQVPVEVLAEEAGLVKTRIKNDSKNATTFATGVVYGLQPDALLMILPALALPSRITGAAFLAMFLLGTVLAMGSYTLFLSSCSLALQKRIPGITKNLTLGSSVIAIALGVGLVVSELFGLSFF